MWKAGGELRRQAIEIKVIFLALLATVGAFGIWWGGTSAPGRPIASVLPLLLLPIAVAFRSAPMGSARRAAQHLLLWISIGIAMTLVISQDGLLLNNARDGTSALLEFWSPRWELWTLAPTFIGQSITLALLHTAWWLAVACAAAFALSRARTSRAGSAALAAAGTLATALVAIALTMPYLPAQPALPRVDLSARSRLSALDGFDSRVRPASVTYDPLHRGAAVEIVPQLTLGVKPAQRTDRQPLRVIHNGRFSLPAGTYKIDVRFNERAADQTWPIALQIGRIGPPLQSWTIRAEAGQVWTTSLWLPVNASFMGIRGPAEMERAIDAITITPVAVVDAGARPIVPTVVAASNYADVRFFFHDERMYPEPGGFWMLGRRTSQITVAVPPGRTGPVVLRIHSGGKPNHITFSTFDWQREVSLVPAQIEEVELPMVTGSVIPIIVTVDDGFYPKDFDPASNDPRFLGIWVEVKPADTPTAQP